MRTTDYDRRVQGNNTVARTLPVTTLGNTLLKSFADCPLTLTVEVLNVRIERLKSLHQSEGVLLLEALNLVSAAYASQMVGGPPLDFRWEKQTDCVL
jgi:hypothetical protein